jgi:hypothetical protein
MVRFLSGPSNAEHEYLTAKGPYDLYTSDHLSLRYLELIRIVRREIWATMVNEKLLVHTRQGPARHSGEDTGG